MAIVNRNRNSCHFVRPSGIVGEGNEKKRNEMNKKRSKWNQKK